MSGKNTDLQSSRPGNSSRRRVGRWLFLVGGPGLLAVAFAVHPRGNAELFATGTAADWWLIYHVVLLPLLGSLGASMYVLLAEFDGPMATVGRAGVGVYLVGYLAFEAIAGIATGIVVRQGRDLSGEQGAVIVKIAESITSDPLVIAFAIVGTAGGILAVIALGTLFRRTGAPLVPVVLLGGAPLAMVGHGGGSADVVGTVLFVVGVVWLDLSDPAGDGSRSST